MKRCSMPALGRIMRALMAAISSFMYRFSARNCRPNLLVFECSRASPRWLSMAYTHIMALVHVDSSTYYLYGLARMVSMSPVKEPPTA